MIEKIKKYIGVHRETMLRFLEEKQITFSSETIDWYTIGHEADIYEIDIWTEHTFFQIYYDKNGYVTRWEMEENCY